MATKQRQFECTADAAKRVGFTRAWVKKLAVTGRIEGATKVGPRAWLIPVDWQPVRQRARKQPVTS